ncbi:MAG: AAA family ATPase, partial [bacterium]|nr:AAA family ATPase [bacterium]
MENNTALCPEGETMSKRFNDTGVCVPKKHYMVDISNKTAKIFEMVRQGDYFTINRPRQYGKTTNIFILNQFLKTRDDYFTIKMSFEAIGSDSYKNEEKFVEAFMLKLKKIFSAPQHNDLAEFVENNTAINSIFKLNLWLTELIEKIGKKTILMIDEVDKSGNNQLFLDFLGMLRDKYLKANEDEDTTFHSVILVGVHDVRSLKNKLRPDDEAKYNSPWNIAVDFKVDLTFSPEEIANMLTDYAKEKMVKIDIPRVAEELFYFTSGYPFLVSHLCKIIDTEILPGKNRKEWKTEDLQQAVQTALINDNTNFGSLIKNLENNPELYNLVFQILINGNRFSFNNDNPVIRLGKLYGILRDEKKQVTIHNRLYEQRIYNYMASKMETSGDTSFQNIASSYVKSDNSLDVEKMIRNFQAFMKEQYSARDKSFLERNGRLLFLAFIRPIINGSGFDFKEVQVSEEKRLDVVITFHNKKYIAEMKIWRGESYHQTGIRQLCDYLD